MAKGAIRIDWYPGDALDGMKFLTPIEELAYRRILDLLYVSGGELPDDDFILGEQTRSLRDWPKIKAALVRKGKIAVANGAVTNARCTEILKAIEERSDKARALGRASGNKRRLLPPPPVEPVPGAAAEATETPAQTPTPSPTVTPTKAPAPLPALGELSHKVMESVRVSKETLTPGSDLSEAWGRFACAYPNKDGITAAERDWRAAVGAGADPVAIHAGLERWQLKWRRARTEDRWIPKPGNWLRDKKWLDPIDGVPAEVKRQWQGPPGLRARIVAEVGPDGEGFAKSYLDPAGWEAPATVIVRTGVAAEKLGRLSALAGMTVTIHAAQGQRNERL